MNSVAPRSISRRAGGTGGYRRVLAVTVLVAGTGAGLVGCGAAREPVSSTAARATVPALHTGSSCTEIGGRFEPRGDGTGSCVPVDARPICHLAPADRPEYYVAEVALDPPIESGTVVWDDAILNSVNGDCWHAPPR